MSIEEASDRSTAAERIPIHGAYDITTAHDYEWEGSIRWSNLRWWALGLAVVGFPVWLFVFSGIPLPVILLGAVAATIVVCKVWSWYTEVAERRASVQLKRSQARPDHRCVKCSSRERRGW